MLKRAPGATKLLENLADTGGAEEGSRRSGNDAMLQTVGAVDIVLMMAAMMMMVMNVMMTMMMMMMRAGSDRVVVRITARGIKLCM